MCACRSTALQVCCFAIVSGLCSITQDVTTVSAREYAKIRVHTAQDISCCPLKFEVSHFELQQKYMSHKGVVLIVTHAWWTVQTFQIPILYFNRFVLFCLYFVVFKLQGTISQTLKIPIQPVIFRLKVIYSVHLSEYVTWV